MVLPKTITPQAGPTVFGTHRRHARTTITLLLCHFALWDGKANRMSQMLVLHASLGTHAVAAAAAPVPSSKECVGCYTSNILSVKTAIFR